MATVGPRAVRRRGLVPTRRLAGVAALASVALLVAPGGGVLVELLAVNGALVLVALVDALLAPAPGSVPVERTLPGAVRVARASSTMYASTCGSTRMSWI